MKGGAPATVWAMAAVFLGLEALFQASDIGLLAQGWRWAAYRHFAFFDLWFEAWRTGQPAPAAFYWSFITHAFLHGGLLHVGMNTVVFLALGAHMTRAVGTGWMLAVFAATAVTGALFFGLIADTGPNFVPMVGASGAIFGFLGAMKRWEWAYVWENRLPQTRFWRTMAALFVVNLILSAGVVEGGVAWEAHLGGFCAGWAIATFLRPRRGTAIGPI